MKYRVEARINSESVKRFDVSDDDYFRAIARTLVSEMPIQELHRMIKLTKTDPNSEESIKTMQNPYAPDHVRDRLFMLKEQNTIIYEAETRLPIID